MFAKELMLNQRPSAGIIGALEYVGVYTLPVGVGDVLGSEIKYLDGTEIVVSSGGNTSTSYMRGFATVNWDGSAFTVVGNVLDGITNRNKKIAPMTPTLMAEVDMGPSGTTEYLRAYTWDGSDWTLAGSQAISSLTAMDVCRLNDTDVCVYNFFDTSPVIVYLETWRWNGSSWTKIGSSFDYTNTNGSTDLFRVNDNTIAILNNDDNPSGGLSLYSFDGSNWSAVADIAISGWLQGYSALNGVVFGDNVFLASHPNDDYVRFFRYNGVDTVTEFGTPYNIIADVTGGSTSGECIFRLNDTQIGITNIGAYADDVYVYNVL